MITIFTFVYNEQDRIIPFCKWYRDRFPNCEIVVYDNMSTDLTRLVLEKMNCKIINWETYQKFSDTELQYQKDTCWKDSETDWNIVCDIDELLDIYPKDLEGDFNIIRSMECLMFEDGFGVPFTTKTSKSICFNKSVGDINYSIGAHFCNPNKPLYSSQVFILYHYRLTSPKRMYQRFKQLAKRLPPESIKKGYSLHYRYSFLRIWYEFKKLRRKAIFIK